MTNDNPGPVTFICCPTPDEILEECPGSQSRHCHYCKAEVRPSPNMVLVDEREEHALFICRSDSCLNKAKEFADSQSKPLSPMLGREYIRSRYDEYPPV